MPLEAVKSIIMFVDIAGSTELYETYGDARAWDCIGRCQAELSRTVEAHGGTVIKAIGDELMCRFKEPDAAVIAACRINEQLVDRRFDVGIRLGVRIGLHYGSGIVDQDDIYGDVVNVATRMTEIAKRGQIIASQEVMDGLSARQSRLVRRFDKASVKGKPATLTIYEVIWEREEITQMIPNTEIARRLGNSAIHVTHRGKETVISPDNPLTVIGRDPHCQLVVRSNLASRIHASIEYRHGKFLLVDQSTNGTYVRLGDNRQIYLRREELPLWGEGIMSLGESITDDSHELMYFACQ